MSRCLLGDNVRYNAEPFDRVAGTLTRWRRDGRIVAVCPEVDGGLPVPRPAAEVVAVDGHSGSAAVLEGRGRVHTAYGVDLGACFVAGAEAALQTARRHGIRMAVLKARSPSCGSLETYDGSFRRRLVPGAGVAAELLSRHGIRVFDEQRLAEAEDYLAALERQPR